LACNHEASLLPLSKQASLVLLLCCYLAYFHRSHMTSQLPADLLSPGQQDALSQLEQQFRLDVQLMQRTLKQFLYEFDEGLGRQATKEEADTFLPMMCAGLRPAKRLR
jgi:hypothetical protein